MTFPTRAELFNTGVNVAVQRGMLRPPKERLTREALITPGTDANIVCAQASFMADDVARGSAQRLGALYLYSATGADLDRLVKDRYSEDVVRKQAGSAVVTLSFTRSSGALLGLTLAVGRKFRTVNGIEFELVSSVSVPAGSNGPVTGVAQAVQPGLAGNVGKTTITSFVDSPPDAALQVTNPAVAAGGDDQESDASLRERALNFFVAARRGTGPAIEFGARRVSGVRYASVVEEVDELGDPTGRVSLYIADANGQSNAALALAVKLSLLEYRGCGIVVDVFSAVPYFQDVTYHLGFLANVDPSAAFAQVQLATVFAVNQLKPKERLQLSLLYATARSVPGVVVNDDSLVVPTGDVVPVGVQIIRTEAARVRNI